MVKKFDSTFSRFDIAARDGRGRTGKHNCNSVYCDLQYVNNTKQKNTKFP